VRLRDTLTVLGRTRARNVQIGATLTVPHKPQKSAIPLPHEQRVHNADCMAAFGRRWLKEAAEALARFGIPAPLGYGPDDT